MQIAKALLSTNKPIRFWKSSKILALAVAISSMVLFFAHPQANAQSRSPHFEISECPVAVPNDVEVDCGYLTVMEDHTNPDGPTIELPIIIIHSLNPDPHPDPILFTEGGPGYSSLSSVWWLSRSELLEERDIIILEQRGNKHAFPSLDCEASMWLEEAEGSMKCLDSLRSRGIDPLHYTTQQNAADVATLRNVFGIEHWNLYGTSYSTRLFLYVIQHYPAGVRSAVLDSVGPPSENRYLHDPEHSARALGKLFEDCQADEMCAAAYPDLEASFYAVYSRLNAVPVSFTITHDLQGQRLDPPRNEQVDGYRFLEWMVSDAFYGPAYDREKTSFLPLLISQVNAGKTEVIRPWLMDEIFTGWGSLENFAWGLYFSINCQNDFPAITPEITGRLSAEYPELEGYVRHAREMEICAIWDLPAAPLDGEPVESDIPTLVLAGGYDPITPPEWGRKTADYLERAYFYEFPAAGHGVVGQSACAREIQSTFLSEPERVPASSCLADEPDAEFILPEEVLIAPGFFTSVADLNVGTPGGNPWLEGVVLIALLIFLLEIIFNIVKEVITFLQRSDGKPPTDQINRLTHPLAGIVSALGIAVPVLMTAINQKLNNDPITRYFGLPAGDPTATVLGVVAPLFTILSAVLIILTIRYTAVGNSSLPKRILLAAVAVMTVVFSILLIRWELVTLLL